MIKRGSHYRIPEIQPCSWLVIMFVLCESSHLFDFLLLIGGASNESVGPSFASYGANSFHIMVGCHLRMKGGVVFES